MLRFFSFLALLLCLSACGPDFIYEKKYNLEGAAWKYSDTLRFDFAIEDSARIYNLYLEVTHATDYKFQNIYTRIFTTFPAGQRIEEVLSLELTEKGASWLGKCSSGVCRLRIPIQEGAYFDQEGQYAITLEQYMRNSPVQGIESIRFLLEQTKDKRTPTH
ncbi:MAG TPA: gliding motility lipoprotein GldH [Saprospiraceae bacterium]|nr:gliding motility lipoprotein GldH [Saprospiraceae bacterium]HMQ83657.1 gliding motility lipoprotein GldH [Saprospiraceae bacterium]